MANSYSTAAPANYFMQFLAFCAKNRTRQVSLLHSHPSQGISVTLLLAIVFFLHQRMKQGQKKQEKDFLKDHKKIKNDKK